MIIPDFITTIGSYVFTEKPIKSITIPIQVKKIGKFSFYMHESSKSRFSAQFTAPNYLIFVLIWNPTEFGNCQNSWENLPLKVCPFPHVLGPKRALLDADEMMSQVVWNVLRWVEVVDRISI